MSLACRMWPLGWIRTGRQNRFAVAVNPDDFRAYFNIRGQPVTISIGGIESRGFVADRLGGVGDPELVVIALARVADNIGRGVLQVTACDDEPGITDAVRAVLGDAAPAPAVSTRELPALVSWDVPQWCCRLVVRGRPDAPPSGDVVAVVGAQWLALSKAGWEWRAPHWVTDVLARSMFPEGCTIVLGAPEVSADAGPQRRTSLARDADF